METIIHFYSDHITLFFSNGKVRSMLGNKRNAIQMKQTLFYDVHLLIHNLQHSMKQRIKSTQGSNEEKHSEKPEVFVLFLLPKTRVQEACGYPSINKMQ